MKDTFGGGVTIHGTVVDGKEDKMRIFCFERERFYFFDKVLRDVRATNLQSRMIQIRGYKTFSSFLPAAQSCMLSHSTRTSIVHVFAHWINIRNRFGHLRPIFLHFLTVNLQLSLQGRFSLNEYYGQKFKWWFETPVSSEAWVRIPPLPPSDDSRDIRRR